MSAMNQHQQNKASLLERLIFNNRPVVIFLCLLVSVFLFYQATQVRPSTSFEKMIPLEHPFIQKMLEHRNDLANLGNTVRISVEAVNGDIFTKEYMETLRQIHDEVFYIPGVDRSGLKSLGAQRALDRSDRGRLRRRRGDPADLRRFAAGAGGTAQQRAQVRADRPPGGEQLQVEHRRRTAAGDVPEPEEPERTDQARLPPVLP